MVANHQNRKIKEVHQEGEIPHRRSANVTLKMATSEKSKEIADRLYKRYGTGTGIVFGIPSSLREAVEWVIEFTLKEKDKKNGNRN